MTLDLDTPGPPKAEQLENVRGMENLIACNLDIMSSCDLDISKYLKYLTLDILNPPELEIVTP